METKSTSRRVRAFLTLALALMLAPLGCGSKNAAQPGAPPADTGGADDAQDAVSERGCPRSAR